MKISISNKLTNISIRFSTKLKKETFLKCNLYNYLNKQFKNM